MHDAGDNMQTVRTNSCEYASMSEVDVRTLSMPCFAKTSSEAMLSDLATLAPSARPAPRLLYTSAGLSLAAAAAACMFHTNMLID